MEKENHKKKTTKRTKVSNTAFQMAPLNKCNGKDTEENSRSLK